MIKQVIVIRKDLKMRRGKEIAQGSHASMSFITDQLRNDKELKLTEIEKEWLKGNFAKVVLQCENEEELDSIATKAKEVGLTCYVIVDSGKTEFHGVPTKTCLAIGPDLAEKIDPITGKLKPY